MSNRLALRDPVDGSTFMALEVAHPLLRTQSLEYLITVREVYAMVRVALFGLNGADEDWDPFLEIEQKIEEARQDRVRLRQRPPIEEVVEIMERNREGLLRLMKLDPARAEEIRAFLEGSQERIRKIVMEHRREVRQQRQGKVN